MNYTPGDAQHRPKGRELLGGLLDPLPQLFRWRETGEEGLRFLRHAGDSTRLRDTPPVVSLWKVCGVLIRGSVGADHVVTLKLKDDSQGV